MTIKETRIELTDAHARLAKCFVYNQMMKEMLMDSLTGKLAFIGRLPCRYADEHADAYRDTKGRILVLEAFGTISTYENAADAIQFYSTLSKSDHNLARIAIFQNVK